MILIIGMQIFAIKINRNAIYICLVQHLLRWRFLEQYFIEKGSS